VSHLGYECSRRTRPWQRRATIRLAGRAGGRYEITGTAEVVLAKLNKKELAKLTTWLVDQRRMGIECPVVSNDTFDRVELRRPLAVQARLDRFLLYRDSLDVPINASIRLRNPDPLHISRLQTLAAWTECIEDAETHWLAVLLSDEGFAKFDNTNYKVTISAAGWRLIESLKHRIGPTSQGFVAMWFHPSTEDAYLDGIARRGTEHSCFLDM